MYINILQNIKLLKTINKFLLEYVTFFKDHRNTVHMLNTDTNIVTDILREIGEKVP